MPGCRVFLGPDGQWRQRRPRASSRAVFGGGTRDALSAHRVPITIGAIGSALHKLAHQFGAPIGQWIIGISKSLTVTDRELPKIQSLSSGTILKPKESVYTIHLRREGTPKRRMLRCIRREQGALGSTKTQKSGTARCATSAGMPEIGGFPRSAHSATVAARQTRSQGLIPCHRISASGCDLRTRSCASAYVASKTSCASRGRQIAAQRIPDGLVEVRDANFMSQKCSLEVRSNAQRLGAIVNIRRACLEGAGESDAVTRMREKTDAATTERHELQHTLDCEPEQWKLALRHQTRYLWNWKSGFTHRNWQMVGTTAESGQLCPFYVDRALPGRNITKIKDSGYWRCGRSLKNQIGYVLTETSASRQIRPREQPIK
jgi:hypothetical protein